MSTEKYKIHILYGEDNFRKGLALNQLKSPLLNGINPDFLSFNYHELSKLDSDKDSILNLINLINTSPLGSDYRVILVNKAKFLDSKLEDDKLAEILLETLINIPSDIHLIFNTEKVLGTLKIAKALKDKDNEHISFQEFKAFTPWQIKEASEWLTTIIKEEYPDLTSGVNPRELNSLISYLVEYLGPEDSSKLHSEVQRLSLSGKSLSIELIEKECRPKYDIFKLAKHIASNDKKGSILELKKIINNQDDLDQAIISALETNILKYYKLKLLDQKKDLSKEDKASMLSVTPGRMYYLQKEVDSMELSHLESLSSRFLNLEKYIRSHGSKDRLHEAFVQYVVS